MHKEMPLHDRLYFDPVYVAVARAIGYAGCEPFAFWDQIKPQSLPQGQVQRALYDLTRYDRREASPPRYEFTESARRLLWQLLGPAPEQLDKFYRHSDGTPDDLYEQCMPPELRSKPAAEEKSKKKRTRKGS